MVNRGNHLDWYEGLHAFSLLETVEVEADLDAAPFRFPVQLVAPPAQ
jgi:sulfate adenylyltransferase subunit 1 (EFTu-like GTPase family)